MLRIDADGVEILGRPRGGGWPIDGLYVGRDGFNGWDDGGGEVRREAVPRPAAVGEFDLPVYEGAMVFSIDGHALCRDEFTLARLRDRFTGIGDGGRRFVVSVEHQGRTLWTWARRAAKPTFRDAGIVHGMRRATIMAQFVAPIPRKYGDVVDFPAGRAAVHRGNTAATPRLMIGPGAGGYTVTGPQGRVIVVATAPADAHYIDFASGGLFTASGVRQTGAITIYQPWSIPRGGPGVIATISGSRSLVQRVADTYT